MTLSDQDFTQFLQALQFSAVKHQAQKRKDGLIPYINHPIEVTKTLWDNGVQDPTTLIAALLHDVIEDTGTLPSEVRERFGEEVLSLVMEVTDDKSLPKAERKRLQIETANHKSPRARQIKLADKINNTTTLIQHPPQDWSIERRREYLDWTEKVVRGLRGYNPQLEALYDQSLARAREALESSV